MGTVLELRPRVANDWTLFERTQLEILVDQVPACEGRDLVFGVTDEGDPWCVALDDRGEVVLHVARIGGSVVVHAMPDNVIAEGHSLSAAMARFINEDFAFRRTSNVSQLFPAAQPMPAHMFATLAEPEVMPVGDRRDEAGPLPATAPAPAASLAAVSELPSYEAAETRFAWDAAPLNLDGDPAPAFSLSDNAPAAAAPSRLMVADNQINIEAPSVAAISDEVRPAAQVQTFNAGVQPAAVADDPPAPTSGDAETRTGGDDLFSLSGSNGPRGGGTVVVDFTTPRPPLEGLTAANDANFGLPLFGARAASMDEAAEPPPVLFLNMGEQNLIWPVGLAPAGTPLVTEVF